MALDEPTSRPVVPEGRPVETTSPDPRSGTPETRPVQARTRRRRRARIIAPVRSRVGLRARLTVTYALGAALLAAVPVDHHLRPHPREPAHPARGVRRHPHAGQRRPSGHPARQRCRRRRPSRPCSAGLPTPEGAQPVLHYQGQWYATEHHRLRRAGHPRPAEDRGRRRATGPHADLVRGEPYLITGRARCPALAAQYYEGLSLADLQRTLDGPGHLAPRRLGPDHCRRRPRRLLGQPAGVRPAARRRPGRRRHRRRAPRHPAAGRRRPRPRRDRRPVQRDGPGPRGPHRARRPLRLARSATSSAPRS